MSFDDNTIASFFDDCASRGILSEFSEEEKGKLKHVIARWDIKPGERVLEPGCGSGRLTGYLAEAVGLNGEVYACDLSAKMVVNALKRGVPTQARFVIGPVEQVNAPDGYFDKVIAFCVFPHFTDREKSLGEMCRVLKKGGSMFVNHLLCRDELNSMHDDAADIVIADPLPDDDTIRTLFTRAGFDVKAIEDCADTGYHLHAVKK